MKITPVQGPLTQPATTPTGRSEYAAKAIAAFNNPPQEAKPHDNPGPEVPRPNPAPVDANAVSAEELQSVTHRAQPDDKHTGEDRVQAEPEATTKPETEVPDKTLTSEYQILARKERALRAKAQQTDKAMRAREAAVKAKEAEIAAKENEFKTNYVSKARLKEAPLDVLAEVDTPYDALVQQMIDQPKTDPRVMAYIQRLEAKIQKLESGVEASQKAMEDQQTQAYQAALKQIRTDAATMVKTDPNFETLRATRSVGDVVDLIEKTYKETGRVMPVEEACQEVEDYLVEEATRLAKLGKIQKRLQPQQKPQPKPQAQPTPMRTLTNATSSTRQLSAKERAVLAFKGELQRS